MIAKNIYTVYTVNADSAIIIREQTHFRDHKRGHTHTVVFLSRFNLHIFKRNLLKSRHPDRRSTSTISEQNQVKVWWLIVPVYTSQVIYLCRKRYAKRIMEALCTCLLRAAASVDSDTDQVGQLQNMSSSRATVRFHCGFTTLAVSPNWFSGGKPQRWTQNMRNGWKVLHRRRFSDECWDMNLSEISDWGELWAMP